MTQDLTVEAFYEKAKHGQWGDVLSAWQKDPRFARTCAHHAKPTSGWSFLHQAAHFGDQAACRELIRSGASVALRSRDGQTPADVAAARGHSRVALLLRSADPGDARLWDAPPDATSLPSSNLWREAEERQADEDMSVSYGGATVRIRRGDRYFVDSFGRVLVGWHGSYNPPRGMDAESILERFTPA